MDDRTLVVLRVCYKGSSEWRDLMGITCETHEEAVEEKDKLIKEIAMGLKTITPTHPWIMIRQVFLDLNVITGMFVITDQGGKLNVSKG